MGSSYFGEPSMGNGRSAGSSRKGKKSSSNSDKPKQPQRGLGVAQLEKIRLHHQMGSNNYLHTSPNYHHHHHHTNLNQQEDVRMETVYSSVSSSSSSSSTSPSSFGFHHPNIMMGFRDMEGTDIRYGDPQSCTITRINRWNHNNGIIETPFNTQPTLTRQLFSFQMEDSAQKKRSKDRCNSLGSSSQNSDSSEMQELDLDLKL